MGVSIANGVSATDSNGATGTFANKPISPTIGTEYFVTDIGGGIKIIYSGSKWKPIDGVATIYHDVTYASGTANGGEQNYKNYLIPGGLLSSTGSLEIYAEGTYTGNAGAKIFQWRHTTASGSVSGGSFLLNTSMGAGAGTLSQNAMHILTNDNSVSSQVFLPNGVAVIGQSSNGAMNTGSINTLNDSYINLNMQGTASDTIGYKKVVIVWRDV